MNEKKVISINKITEAFKKIDSPEVPIPDFEKIINNNTLELLNTFVKEYPEVTLLEKIKEFNYNQLQLLYKLFQEYEIKEQKELEIQYSIEESKRFNKELLDILKDGLNKKK
ncbi:MAG: hypothetical protein RR478_02590 [Bacilli bacterium]